MIALVLDTGVALVAHDDGRAIHIRQYGFTVPVDAS